MKIYIVLNQHPRPHSFETFSLHEGASIEYELRVTEIPQISPNFIF